MSRVPGTYANEGRKVRMSLFPSPKWSAEQFEKARSGELLPSCHDGSPSADVRCPTCFATAHFHLSQIEPAPAGAEIALPCHICGTVAILDRDEAVFSLRQAFGL